MKPFSRVSLLFFTLGLMATPVQALDRTDFPIKVYVNPLVKSTETGQPPQVLAQDHYMALRQGVVDWNALLAALPAIPTSEIYTLVLKRQNTIKPNLQSFMVLTERPEDADIFVEGVDVFDLQNAKSDNESTNVGIFKSQRGYRIGKIEVSLRRENNKVASSLDLRSTMIHEIGHALKLDHVASEKEGLTKCNIMAASVYYACPLVADPGCSDKSTQDTLCLGIADRQLRKVFAQLTSEEGQSIPPEYEELIDYNQRIEDRIAERVVALTLKEVGTISLKITKAGTLVDLKITKSFGNASLDEQVKKIVQKSLPFGPLPVSYDQSELTQEFSYVPNPDLITALTLIKDKLTSQITNNRALQQEGMVELTINGKGELVNYQLDPAFGKSTNNPKMLSLLESFFPVKPLPGVDKRHKITTGLMYSPLLAKTAPPVKGPFVTTSAPLKDFPVSKAVPAPYYYQPRPSNTSQDMRAYNDQLNKFVQSNWVPPLSPVYREVTVFFTITRDGKVTDIRIGGTSGDAQADAAALRAIRSTALNPLPKSFRPNFLNSQYTFYIQPTPGTTNQPPVDLKPYMEMLQQRIKSNWLTTTDASETAEVLTAFTVQTDGTISDILITKSSGNTKSDQAAIAALRRTTLDPLPKGAPSFLTVNFKFTTTKY